MSSYLITPSLLNSWGRIFTCINEVKESEKDTISLEDKRLEKQIQARQDFINTLNRIETPSNKAIERGIKYEDLTYKGLTLASPLVEGGSFQIVGKKLMNISGLDLLLYGRLDALKGGRIYDIKCLSSRYYPGKYLYSYQHDFYMTLFPSVKEFNYLIYETSPNDEEFERGKLHVETYYNNLSEEKTINTIKVFLSWLKTNNLLDIYLTKWRTKND